VSIGPILSVPGVRDALRSTKAKVAVVSPIVGGKTIKGPADRMLRDQNIEASALGVAKLYADFLDVMVIDNADEALADAIREVEGRRGVLEAVVTDTIMSSMEKKAALAKAVLLAAGK
jgi:LPPG:FO 2-phospho-L-lactate transferase